MKKVLIIGAVVFGETASKEFEFFQKQSADFSVQSGRCVISNHKVEDMLPDPVITISGQESRRKRRKDTRK